MLAGLAVVAWLAGLAVDAGLAVVACLAGNGGWAGSGYWAGSGGNYGQLIAPGLAVDKLAPWPSGALRDAKCGNGVHVRY